MSLHTSSFDKWAPGPYQAMMGNGRSDGGSHFQPGMAGPATAHEARSHSKTIVPTQLDLREFVSIVCGRPVLPPPLSFDNDSDIGRAIRIMKT